MKSIRYRAFKHEARQIVKKYRVKEWRGRNLLEKGKVAGTALVALLNKHYSKVPASEYYPEISNFVGSLPWPIVAFFPSMRTALLRELQATGSPRALQCLLSTYIGTQDGRHMADECSPDGLTTAYELYLDYLSEWASVEWHFKNLPLKEQALVYKNVLAEASKEEYGGYFRESHWVLIALLPFIQVEDFRLKLRILDFWLREDEHNGWGPYLELSKAISKDAEIEEE